MENLEQQYAAEVVKVDAEKGLLNAESAVWKELQSLQVSAQ